jgi:hypothetical protein
VGGLDGLTVVSVCFTARGGLAVCSNGFLYRVTVSVQPPPLPAHVADMASMAAVFGHPVAEAPPMRSGPYLVAQEFVRDRRLSQVVANAQSFVLLLGGGPDLPSAGHF